MQINQHTSKILKTLRRRTDFSQKKVATALGRSQSYVSRIEHGLKLPNVQELQTILQLLEQKTSDYDRLMKTQLYLEELAERVPNKPPKKALPFQSLQQSEIIHLVSNYFKNKSVEKAWLFGSFARQTQHEESDIDILIQFQKDYKATLIDLIQIKQQLEELTGYAVDVVENGSEYEFIRDSIHQDKIVLYG